MATRNRKWNVHKLIAASFVAVGLAGAPAAMAESRVVNIDKASASVSLGTIASGGEVLARGLSVAGKAVSNVLKFRPGESALRVNTSWVVGEPDAKFRLIGVNVDLLDASGSVIASDTFQGLVAGTALSTLLTDGLVPGTLYQLKITGTAVARGSYSMAIRPLPAT
jgi:hypothetical protein